MTCGSVKWLRGIAATEQGGLCYHCRKRMTKPGEDLPTSLTADHLIPIAHGGRSTRANIVAACLKCNSDKADQLKVKEPASRHPKRTKREQAAVDNQRRKQQARHQMWREGQVSRGCTL